MVALVDALEDRGFVTRQRDPADRRGQRVGATTKGATALERGQWAVRVAEEEFLEGLSKPEQREFRRLLSKLIANRSPPSN